MAFRLIRERREKRRVAKLDEIFQVTQLQTKKNCSGKNNKRAHSPMYLIHDVCAVFQIYMMRYRNFKKASLIQDRDKSNTGKISFDQLGDIFRIYQVKTNAFNASNIK